MMEKPKKYILIAGGTGFIGKSLTNLLEKNGYHLAILTRNLKKADNKRFFFWNPDTLELELPTASQITHIINLCGSGIAEKRWTNSRKKELLDSRTKPVDCLLTHIQQFTSLEHYISASGVNCYDFNNASNIYSEEDAYAEDFLSQVVKKWEEKALLMEKHCPVTCLRIGVVLSKQGGAVEKMEMVIKKGFGSNLGSGKQALPWISLNDLCRLFEFVVRTKTVGIYNAVTDNTDNRTITSLLAKKWGKSIWLPAVPSFILKIMLGEMAVLVLKGIKADNAKINKSGFHFLDTDLSSLLIN